MDEFHEPLHEAYDVDVAKLNRLAARSAERAEKLKAENEKLRELVREYAEIANYICEVYNWCGQEYDHCKYDPLNNDMCKLGKLNGRARELGIEVDG